MRLRARKYAMAIEISLYRNFNGRKCVSYHIFGTEYISIATSAYQIDDIDRK